jgi:hypothetical protein
LSMQKAVASNSSFDKYQKNIQLVSTILSIEKIMKND